MPQLPKYLLQWLYRTLEQFHSKYKLQKEGPHKPLQGAGGGVEKGHCVAYGPTLAARPCGRASSIRTCRETQKHELASSPRRAPTLSAVAQRGEEKPIILPQGNLPKEGRNN